MSLRQRDILAHIEYPETDGQPMGETDRHIQLIIDLRMALRHFYRAQPDVYVGSNLLLYYVEGDPRKFVVPDVFVARGVGNHTRRIFKLWEEAAPPSAVIEVMSRGTWGEDLQRKWKLYERLGVKEYFIFDPEYDYLPKSAGRTMLAYRLVEGEYAELEAPGGRVRSEELGLELVDTGETLRLFNPQTGAFLLTPDEEAEERVRLTEAYQRAEAEASQLREELERLRRRGKSRK
jgi:Uma2 family endonuclease